MKPTNSIVNLVVANETFVDDPQGVALRTVELFIVRVAQAACATGVRLPINKQIWCHETCIQFEAIELQQFRCSDFPLRHSGRPSHTLPSMQVTVLVVNLQQNVLLSSDCVLRGEYLLSQDYSQCYQSTAVFNAHWYSQFNGILNIVRTLFVTFALGFAMIIFNKDAQRLVLRPIERMLRKVKEVSENPLAGSKIHSRLKVKARLEDHCQT